MMEDPIVNCPQCHGTGEAHDAFARNPEGRISFPCPNCNKRGKVLKSDYDKWVFGEISKQRPIIYTGDIKS